MKQAFKSLVLASVLAVFAVGCSTSAPFRIPEGQTLKVTDRTVVLNNEGVWKTSPFFWSTAGGAPYRLIDKDGNIVRQGKIKTQFRAASIFWPPFALIYWPMGLNKDGFDMTKPGDGYQVVDYPAPGVVPGASHSTVAPAAPIQESTVKKPAKKKK